MASGLTPEESPAVAGRWPEGLRFFEYLSSDSGAAASLRDFAADSHPGRWACPSSARLRR